MLFFSNYRQVYTSLYFIEYIFFIGWHLWGKVVKMWLLSENIKEKKEEKKKETLQHSNKDSISEKKED